MHTVLFVAYNFAPAGGVGAQRSLGFVKYLAQYGWQPIVIATTPDAHPTLDESTWKAVPSGTPLYRVRSYDVRGLQSLLVRLKLRKLYTAITLVLKLPDAALFWPRLARSTARHAVEQHQPDLVYSSSGPLSAHWLGMWARRAFGLPWVADFRDRWWTEEWPPERSLPGYRAINRRMARDVLLAADLVITVSEPLADSLRRLSGQSRPSMSVIENGYDEDDIVPFPPQHTERFTIVHTGTLNRKRPADAVIAAVQQLVRDGQIPVERIRVVFAGRGVDKCVPSLPPFDGLGFLGRDALVELRRQSDLFLLLLDESPKNLGLCSGKVFEYLGSNRPTLVVSHPDNVGAQLVERARAGVTTRHDPSEIAAAILHYYGLWRSGVIGYSPDWNVIRQYTRRRLSARLAAEFDRLVASGAAS